MRDREGLSIGKKEKRQEEIIVAGKNSGKSGIKASGEAEGDSMQNLRIYRQEEWVGDLMFCKRIIHFTK